ncbi:DUF2273 domain-containing protein [Kocuria sp. TGY1127_2]|uniref:DUF2273 domain-containing protein n=1 Tax=Kocuria sp. TGY1127_2 TaxID=2711328 RepID=UPI0015B8070D|nr:DUF2273 domain-containing protein [Kocuria sp. TGY1127_2]
MTEYALNDRGSLELVTEDYYDAEILRMFDGRRLDREQVLDAVAHLVPEPDNPWFPGSVAVWVAGHKVARMTPEDSERYWKPLARIVVSGYIPVAPIRYWATQRRENGHSRLETKAVLSVSRPELLFPINSSPVRAALLPQGPSVKVLDENDYAEYLHDVLPVSGEGRVILTLEANRHKMVDGHEVDVVDVLHDRRVVGRLSTQMSEQLAPVVRYAFENNKLTAVWGTIRGSSYELSLTVQAVRADDIPRSWYLDLPNSVPQLKPRQETYELDPAYVPTEAEADPDLKRPPKPGEEPYRAYPLTHGSTAASGGRSSRHGDYRTAIGLGALGALLVILGIVFVFFKPVLGVLGILIGASIAFVGLYIGRIQGPARLEDFTYEEPYSDDEQEPEDDDSEYPHDQDVEATYPDAEGTFDDESSMDLPEADGPEQDLEAEAAEEYDVEAVSDANRGHGRHLDAARYFHDQTSLDSSDGYETIGQESSSASQREYRD